MCEKRYLSDIAEVREIYNPESANEHLKRGWILLDQLSRLGTQPKNYTSVYVLARPKSVEPDTMSP